MAYIKPFKLKLGQDYEIGTRKVRLIKSTKKGYNFLSHKTNKCMMQSHVYPSKESNHTKNNETWFWLPANWKFTEFEIDRKYYLFDDHSRCYYYGLDSWENTNWGNNINNVALYTLATAETLMKEFEQKSIRVWIGIKEK